MRMILAMGCAVTLTLVTTFGPARACGDTELGTGHDRVCSARSSARAFVLVFQDPSEPDGSLLRDPELAAALASAGLTQRVASSLEAVKQVLSEQRFDVLLASARSAPAVRSLLGASNERPAILPVVHRGTKEETSAARETYGAVVESPARARTLVAAIEDAAGR